MSLLQNRDLRDLLRGQVGSAGGRGKLGTGGVNQVGLRSMARLDALEHFSGHEDVLIALLGAVDWCRAETRTKHLDRSSIGSLVVGIMVTTDSRIDGNVNASLAEGVLS